jgi:hypothetical protein
MSQQTAPRDQIPVNPFGNDAPARPQQMTAAPTQLHVRRTGLIPMAIGAARIIRGKDGMRRQYEAREMRTEIARAERDGRTLRISCVCFECRKNYPSFEALAGDHPTTAEMKELNESHTFAYWCDDNFDPKGVENIDALKGELQALEAAHKSAVQGIAKLSDVEKIMAERKRCDEIKKTIDDTEKKKNIAVDNIIGIMSEEPWPESRGN